MTVRNKDIIRGTSIVPLDIRALDIITASKVFALIFLDFYDFVDSQFRILEFRRMTAN